MRPPHPWHLVRRRASTGWLVGTPPTVIFVGKLATTAAVWDGGHAWLAVIVFVNTVASLFYYLRWIAPVYGREAAPARTLSGASSPARWSATTAVVTAALSLALGIGAGALWSVLVV